VRSRSIALSDDAKEVGTKCWSIHSYIPDIVCPWAIIAMGSDASSFIRSKASRTSSLQSFPSGHGEWMCTAEKLMLNEHELVLITIQHLSRYAINHHPDVIH
jgi:hypothetical protein